MNASRLCRGLVTVLAAAAVGILTALSMDRAFNPYDEGVIYAGAMRVADGLLPHRDFYANYGPAQFYLFAILFKLLQPAAIVARLWGCLIKACLVLAAFRIGRRIAGTYIALLGAGVAAVWLCLADMTVWPAWSALLLVLLSGACLITVFDGRASRYHLKLAGFLVGSAALFRYDIGVLVFCAESLVLVLYALARSRSPGRSLLQSVWALRGYVVGVMICILPLLGWFAANGMLGDFFFDVVAFPSKHYAATRGLPFPVPVASMLPASLAEYIVYGPAAVCVAALALLARDARTVWRASGGLAATDATHSADPARWWSMLLLVLLTLAFFAKGVVRVSVIHMTPAVVLASLVMLSFERPRGRPLTTGLVMFAVLAMGLPTLFALDDLRFQIGRQGSGSAPLPPRVKDIACGSLRCSGRAAFLRVDPNEERAVDFVRAHTAPDEVVFSGLAHHDRVFANDAGFYFLSGRQPATKWYHFDPGLQTTAEIQRAIIGDLQRTRPRLVAINASWDYSREPNDSARSSGVFLLDEFLAAHCHTVARFGPIAVCELEL